MDDVEVGIQNHMDRVGREIDRLKFDVADQLNAKSDSIQLEN